jgi:hypothetical protein
MKTIHRVCIALFLVFLLASDHGIRAHRLIEKSRFELRLASLSSSLRKYRNKNKNKNVVFRRRLSQQQQQQQQQQQHRFQDLTGSIDDSSSFLALAQERVAQLSSMREQHLLRTEARERELLNAFNFSDSAVSLEDHLKEAFAHAYAVQLAPLIDIHGPNFHTLPDATLLETLALSQRHSVSIDAKMKDMTKLSGMVGQLSDALTSVSDVMAPYDPNSQKDINANHKPQSPLETVTAAVKALDPQATVANDGHGGVIKVHSKLANSDDKSFWVKQVSGLWQWSPKANDDCFEWVRVKKPSCFFWDWDEVTPTYQKLVSQLHLNDKNPMPVTAIQLPSVTEVIGSVGFGALNGVLFGAGDMFADAFNEPDCGDAAADKVRAATDALRTALRYSTKCAADYLGIDKSAENEAACGKQRDQWSTTFTAMQGAFGACTSLKRLVGFIVALLGVALMAITLVGTVLGSAFPIIGNAIGAIVGTTAKLLMILFSAAAAIAQLVKSIGDLLQARMRCKNGPCVKQDIRAMISSGSEIVGTIAGVICLSGLDKVVKLPKFKALFSGAKPKFAPDFLRDIVKLNDAAKTVRNGGELSKGMVPMLREGGKNLLAVAKAEVAKVATLADDAATQIKNMPANLADDAAARVAALKSAPQNAVNNAKNAADQFATKAQNLVKKMTGHGGKLGKTKKAASIGHTAEGVAVVDDVGRLLSAEGKLASSEASALSSMDEAVTSTDEIASMVDDVADDVASQADDVISTAKEEIKAADDIVDDVAKQTDDAADDVAKNADEAADDAGKQGQNKKNKKKKGDQDDDDDDGKKKNNNGKKRKEIISGPGFCAGLETSFDKWAKQLAASHGHPLRFRNFYDCLSAKTKILSGGMFNENHPCAKLAITAFKHEQKWLTSRPSATFWSGVGFDVQRTFANKHNSVVLCDTLAGKIALGIQERNLGKSTLVIKDGLAWKQKYDLVMAGKKMSKNERTPVGVSCIRNMQSQQLLNKFKQSKSATSKIGNVGTGKFQKRKFVARTVAFDLFAAQWGTPSMTRLQAMKSYYGCREPMGFHPDKTLIHWNAVSIALAAYFNQYAQKRESAGTVYLLAGKFSTSSVFFKKELTTMLHGAGMKYPASKYFTLDVRVSPEIRTKNGQSFTCASALQSIHKFVGQKRFDADTGAQAGMESNGPLLIDQVYKCSDHCAGSDFTTGCKAESQFACTKDRLCSQVSAIQHANGQPQLFKIGDPMPTESVEEVDPKTVPVSGPGFCAAFEARFNKYVNTVRKTNALGPEANKVTFGLFYKCLASEKPLQPGPAYDANHPCAQIAKASFDADRFGAQHPSITLWSGVRSMEVQKTFAKRAKSVVLAKTLAGKVCLGIPTRMLGAATTQGMLMDVAKKLDLSTQVSKGNDYISKLQKKLSIRDGVAWKAKLDRAQRGETLSEREMQPVGIQSKEVCALGAGFCNTDTTLQHGVWRSSRSPQPSGGKSPVRRQMTPQKQGVAPFADPPGFDAVKALKPWRGCREPYGFHPSYTLRQWEGMSIGLAAYFSKFAQNPSTSGVVHVLAGRFAEDTVFAQKELPTLLHGAGSTYPKGKYFTVNVRIAKQAAGAAALGFDCTSTLQYIHGKASQAAAAAAGASMTVAQSYVCYNECAAHDYWTGCQAATQFTCGLNAMNQRACTPVAAIAAGGKPLEVGQPMTAVAGQTAAIGTAAQSQT